VRKKEAATRDGHDGGLAVEGSREKQGDSARDRTVGDIVGRGDVAMHHQWTATTGGGPIKESGVGRETTAIEILRHPATRG